MWITGYLKALHPCAKRLSGATKNAGRNNIAELTVTVHPLVVSLNAHHHRIKYTPTWIYRLLDQSLPRCKNQHQNLQEDVHPHENSLQQKESRVYLQEVGLYRI
jgi:hypothetical protein